MFNDLLEDLEENGFQVFAYADDLAIVGRKETKAREAIDIVEKWTEKNKMTINKKKSGIIFYKKKKRKRLKDNDIAGYPIVEEYKYLGIWMDQKMTFEKQY